MKLNRIFLALLFLACVIIAQAGSYHWNEGEVLKTGPFLNAAFDQKMDRDRLILSTPTDVSATNTIVIPVTVSYVRIKDNATDSTNLLSLAAASEGQIIYIYNHDASSTSGVATITTLHVGSVMYASASWRLLGDE